MKEGRKPEYPEKIPGDELQKKLKEDKVMPWLTHFAFTKRPKDINSNVANNSMSTRIKLKQNK